MLADKVKALFYRFKSALTGSRTYSARPTVSELLGDPFVDAEIRQAWYESNPHAREVPTGQPGSNKREQGGWLVWNKRTGRLSVIRVPAGARDGLAIIVGTRPADSAEQEVVAWFHTHPNTPNEGYSNEPGVSDLAFTHAEAKVPGLSAV
jgi:hypothetical protein